MSEEDGDFDLTVSVHIPGKILAGLVSAIGVIIALLVKAIY